MKIAVGSRHASETKHLRTSNIQARHQVTLAKPLQARRLRRSQRRRQRLRVLQGQRVYLFLGGNPCLVAFSWETQRKTTVLGGPTLKKTSPNSNGSITETKSPCQGTRLASQDRKQHAQLGSIHTKRLCSFRGFILRNTGDSMTSCKADD